MNPKMKLIALAIIALVSTQAVSENVIRVQVPITNAGSKITWSPAEPTYTDWVAETETCDAWIPDPSTVNMGVSFEQTRTCTYEETRQVQAREYSAYLDEYRNLGEPTPETRPISNTETQNAVGTKFVTSSFEIQNPVPGVNGIYQVKDTATNTTFNAYVNMTYDGGYWVLAAYWVVPSEMIRTNGQLVYRGGTLATYTRNASIYPVIPSGKINGSTRALLRSENGSWISLFGQWQSFDTMPAGSIAPNYSATTSIGNKTIYPRNAGWPNYGNPNITSSGSFGFWTTYGNGGPCGGENRVGTNKMCVMADNGYSSHGDSSTNKFFYLKAQ